MMLDFSIKYLQILKTKLAGLNLTTILDSDEFYHKQILDSINPYLQSDLFKAHTQKRGVVLDVGFGGGFPILPLAKLLPEITFVGVESRRKKVDAVNLIVKELGLNNVKLVHSRLEDFLVDRPVTMTFKAVGTAKDFLPAINHTTIDVSVFFYKGPNFLQLEGTDLPKLENHWKLLENQLIDVPGTQQRYLVSFAAQIVPRGTSKSLVKLSDFL